MTFLEDYVERKKQEFMSHVSEDIQARLEKPEAITLEEYLSTKLNSYERKLVIPKLDDKAFIFVLKYCMSHSFKELPQWKLARHYEEAVTCELLPQLIRRFKNVINKDV